MTFKTTHGIRTVTPKKFDIEVVKVCVKHKWWWRLLAKFGIYQKRKLVANWTIEKAEELKALHGLDVECELANIIAAELKDKHQHGKI